MAQNIKIRRIDELGETLEKSQLNFADIVNTLEEIDEYKTDYPVIAKVNPYDDTIFNRLQLSQVIEDLRKLQDNITDIKLKNIINQTIIFFEKVDLHEYIELIGD